MSDSRLDAEWYWCVVSQEGDGVGENLDLAGTDSLDGRHKVHQNSAAWHELLHGDALQQKYYIRLLILHMLWYIWEVSGGMACFVKPSCKKICFNSDNVQMGLIPLPGHSLNTSRRQADNIPAALPGCPHVCGPQSARGSPWEGQSWCGGSSTPTIN